MSVQRLKYVQVAGIYKWKMRAEDTQCNVEFKSLIWIEFFSTSISNRKNTSNFKHKKKKFTRKIDKTLNKYTWLTKK